MNDWYKKHLTEKMEKEASFKEGLIISLISILSSTAAWFEASQIRDFLDKKGVPYEEFAETLNQINDTVKPFEEIDKGDVILAKDHLDNFNMTSDTPLEATREGLSPFDTIARTIYDEARGEGLEGMTVVADVILNRSNGTPESLKEICLKPFQFSGWNNGKMLEEGYGETWEASKNLTNQILNPNIVPKKN